MKIVDYLRTYLDDAKAWKRKEKRVAGRALRGRVYERKDGSTTVGDTVVKVKKEPVATLTMKVTRANGTVETITVPAQVTQHNG